jgi:uncharacterized membrane protein YfcA
MSRIKIMDNFAGAAANAVIAPIVIPIAASGGTLPSDAPDSLDSSAGGTPMLYGGGVSSTGTGSTGYLKQARVLCSPIATVLTSMAQVLAYGTLLSRASLAVSTPALFVVLAASTLSSIAGFAFSAICGAMLLGMMNDPVRIVEIMMLCSIAIQSVSVATLWRDINWRDLRVFLIGGTLGLPIGVVLLLRIGHVGFREAMGGLLTAYAAYALFKRPLTITSGGKLADAFVGFLGGITGGLAGFPGAAVTIWCGMRGLDKRSQRGTYQPFILIMQIIAIGLIQVLRTPMAGGHSIDLELFLFVPAALLGTRSRLAIFRCLSDRLFALSINLLLLASGLGLMIQNS